MISKPNKYTGAQFETQKKKKNENGHIHMINAAT